MTYQPAKRYHRIDGWRGYSIPRCALVGASDTGTWEDSPCRTEDAIREIRAFQRQVLRPLGIHSRQRFGTSSNVFCGKRWVVVSPRDFPIAAEATVKWLAEHDRDLRLLHEADLDKCAVN